MDSDPSCPKEEGEDGQPCDGGRQSKDHFQFGGRHDFGQPEPHLAEHPIQRPDSHDSHDWIGFWENLHRKPWFLPLKKMWFPEKPWVLPLNFGVS